MTMNLPNKLTIFRVILIPFFVACMLIPSIPFNNIIACVIFCVASFTDFLDGYLARRDGLVCSKQYSVSEIARKLAYAFAIRGNLRKSALKSFGHIRSRISVRHRKYVQIVYFLSMLGKHYRSAVKHFGKAFSVYRPSLHLSSK